MSRLSPLCVYCGSAPGASPAYMNAAHELGSIMAARGIALVYGGGKRGLMGGVAEGVLAGNGRVTGVITRQLVDKELAHHAVSDMHIVDTMHQRKKIMVDRAGAFVALPGGVGTMDELFEVLAWGQLGLHNRPVGLLNTEGFYDALLVFLDKMRSQRFLRLNLDSALVVSNSPAQLLDQMEQATPDLAKPHGQE